MKYQIFVKTVQDKILVYNNVSSYIVLPGDFIEFVDEKTKETKQYHASKCDINKVEEWKG